MGFCFRPFPGLKVRITKRGVRTGIGPRWLRLWSGAGGTGVSTGAGPVSFYKPLGCHKTVPVPVYHGTLPDGWTCSHRHRYPGTAQACARKELRRRQS